MRKNSKPCKVIAAYDSETCNATENGIPMAYPVCHQVGLIDCSVDLRDVTAENVGDLVSVDVYRHAKEAYAILDYLIELGSRNGIVPVVMVHNLGFDMHGLAPWLIAHGCDVLARSTSKPITFTARDDQGEPCLVIWDTLEFFAKSLESMGEECGMPKLMGSWDYDKTRTPETPLTESEIAYAERDITTLFAYTGFWMRRHPLIDETELSQRVCTKTSVVRLERERLFGDMFSAEAKRSAGRMWAIHTQRQKPKSNDELWTMQACTRGGLVFCAEKWASVPLDLSNGYHVIGYDATSMHPSQMTAHEYPLNFEVASKEVLQMDMGIVTSVTVEKMLDKFNKPFPVAFCAAIDFENLRPKKGTPFVCEGIFTLANSRRGWPEEKRRRKADYKDSWSASDEAFGKVKSAEHARLYLTELEFWLINQIYDYDSAQAIHGYETGRFCKPTDLAVLGVGHYYDQKRQAKQALQSREIEKAEYDMVKSKLNSLYGIEITNEVHGDQHLIERAGIVQETAFGIEDLPNFCKTWYQFGQRIVGWSRIAQALIIMLIYADCAGIVCGDTDSIKAIVHDDSIDTIKSKMELYARAVDTARERTCARASRNYGNALKDMEGMGHYVEDLRTDRFFSAWNKAYMHGTSNDVSIVVAGLPTDKGEHSYNDLAKELMEVCTWNETCETLLGYNVTIGHGVTKLNDKVVPEFGEWFDGEIDGVRVNEPCAMAIRPCPITIGGSADPDNARNMQIAVSNNPNVRTEPTYIDYIDGTGYVIERMGI